MKDEEVRKLVLNAYPKEFAAYQELLAIAKLFWNANSDKVFIDPKRPSTRAVTALYAKATKTYAAIGHLASYGYGEDAMVLTRSLVAVCIDLGFICSPEPNEQDTLARQWIAYGHAERRKLFRGVGYKEPDEVSTDWSEVESLAERWSKTNIYRRAERAGLEDVYKTAYRHGSSFEHSDSWSALSYLRHVGTEVELRTARTDDSIVAHALFVGAYALMKITEVRARFYRIDYQQAEHRIEEVFSSGFITEPQPPSMPSEST